MERTLKPFNYIVPASRFPESIEVWDMNGQPKHKVAELPLADDVPMAFGSVRTGPRPVNWRADSDATLYWVEAADGGNSRTRAEIRDRLYILEAPFTGEPVKLLDLDLRFSGILWGTDQLAMPMGRWWPLPKQLLTKSFAGA